MAKIVKKTSGGGTQVVVTSVLSLPVFLIGFAALGAAPVALPAWLLWTFGLKKAAQEEAEERFPEEMRDALARKGFQQGATDVTVTKRSWSNAAIPLPNKLTTKYFLTEEDD